ncbi:YidC/Oxa1 family membrane protein insertase [Microbacterium aoyamense]|uniref:Membrane protein insertase YidC n=1 Tax=Microbacterium aoyamense TaxID=344166 RepID=A0ABN2PZ04_9MICO|nr:membrane protein insertase YidC [Microbacterium aoyamense]
MDLFAFPPIAFILDLAYSGLVGLSTLLSPLTAASAALAVVLVTLLVRAALIPTGISQAKAEQTRARLAPRLRELQKRWGKNPERLQRETMQLYRDENTSPFAGCLPILIQAPIVGVLYAIFLHPMIAGHPNALLTETLFGVPLGSSLAGTLAGGAMDASSITVFGVLVLLIAGVGELTRRLLRPEPVPPVEGSSIPSIPIGLIGVLQFATAVVAIFVPLAAGLYLLVTVAWTLGQRLVLRRVFPPTPRNAA